MRLLHSFLSFGDGRNPDYFSASFYLQFSRLSPSLVTRFFRRKGFLQLYTNILRFGEES